MAILAIGGATALISAGMGAYQAYEGGKQKEKGEKALKGLKAPTYEIPEEVKKNLSMAEQKALEGLPSEMKKEYVQNIDRQTQETLNASAERKGGLLGIQQSAQEATDAFTNLTSMDAAARAENEQKLTIARNQMAVEKQKQFEVKEGRYQGDLASAQAMIGAGSQNIMGGIDQIGGSILQGGAMAISGMGNKQGGVDDSLPTTPTTSSNSSGKSNSLSSTTSGRINGKSTFSKANPKYQYYNAANEASQFPIYKINP